MMDIRITPPVVFSVLAALSFAFFGVSCSPRPDALSGATDHVTQKNLILPPNGADYDVLGVRAGVKGFVVKYDDTVFRGGMPNEDSAASTLHTLGIKTIISAAPTDFERAMCEEYGFELVEIPFSKNSGLSSSDLSRYLNAIRTASAPFYIHCKGGSHRGGILGANYRVFILNWSVERALTEYDILGGDPETDGPMIEALKRMAP